MGLMTGEQYLEGLRAQKPEIYSWGEQVQDRLTYPAFRSTLNTWGTCVYEAAFREDLRGVMVTPDSIAGGECHVFWHIPRTREELLQSLEATKRLAEQAPASSYTRLGRDELASLYVVDVRMDREVGTDYVSRLESYITQFQDGQLMTAAAMTDAKGHRRLRPADQPNPDAYLRVVERRSDGIVVRGSKMHIAGAVASRELVVIPGRAMREQDSDYAVAFAVPVDAPGLKLISREAERQHDPESSPISAKDAVVDSFAIFEDVFVPWDRVFMCGEWQYAGEVSNTFAGLIRQGYLGTDVGRHSIYIGAAALIAELNGVSDASHIQTSISELIKLQSLTWSAAVAASVDCAILPPGVAMPNPVLTNAGQQLARESQYAFNRLLLEIAGGAAVTIPSGKDAHAPALAPYFDKYFAAAGSADDRMRMLRFIRDLAASPYAGWWCVETTHRAGSPAGERIQLLRDYDVAAQKALVRGLAGLE